MELEICKQLSKSIDSTQYISCVKKFYEDCNFKIDFSGFMSNTLERFALATYLNRGDWDLWLADEQGIIKAYLLASVDKAADNKLCYFIHQAWIDKNYRNNGFSKECWEKIKKRAKSLFCSQIIIYSVRNYEAYNRFLGGTLTPYSEMLHMKLED